MKSVASVLRARTGATIRRMSPAERVKLVFRLGDEAIESFRATHAIDRRTAIRLLERRRQATPPALRLSRPVDRVSLLDRVAAILDRAGARYAVIGASAMAAHVPFR